MYNLLEVMYDLLGDAHILLGVLAVYSLSEDMHNLVEGHTA